MTFNDITQDPTLVYTPEAKQIILDTIAQYPYFTLARIYGVWAGVVTQESTALLGLLIPAAAIYYPPTLQKNSRELALSSEINSIDLAAPYMTDNQPTVSETMAQIYTQQGNFHSAIEVYDKLCLKNPEKSSYFVVQKEKLVSYLENEKLNLNY